MTTIRPNEGRAFVYLGSASGFAATPVWTGESNQALSGFGVTVAAAGDVNGNGLPHERGRAQLSRTHPLDARHLIPQ
jgi:hypothetical protein